MELIQICNTLKKTRREKKITLEEVSKKTKLLPSVIRKIEAAKELNDIGKVYLKGFLKIYASFLGLDHLRKDIDDCFTEEKTKEPLLKASKRETKPASLKLTELKEQKRTAFTNPLEKLNPLISQILSRITLPKIRFNLKKLVIFLLSIIVAISLVNFLKRPRRRSQPAPAAIEEKTQTPKVKETSLPTVGVLIKKNVFITVKADGKLIFQNVVLAGAKESWQANKKLEIKINNPSLVTLEIRDQIIPTANQKTPAVYEVTKEGFRLIK